MEEEGGRKSFTLKATESITNACQHLASGKDLRQVEKSGGGSGGGVIMWDNRVRDLIS